MCVAAKITKSYKCLIALKLINLWLDTSQNSLPKTGKDIIMCTWHGAEMEKMGEWMSLGFWRLPRHINIMRNGAPHGDGSEFWRLVVLTTATTPLPHSASPYLLLLLLCYYGES